MKVTNLDAIVNIIFIHFYFTELGINFEHIYQKVSHLLPYEALIALLRSNYTARLLFSEYLRCGWLPSSYEVPPSVNSCVNVMRSSRISLKSNNIISFILELHFAGNATNIECGMLLQRNYHFGDAQNNEIQRKLLTICAAWSHHKLHEWDCTIGFLSESDSIHCS